MKLILLISILFLAASLQDHVLTFPSIDSLLNQCGVEDVPDRDSEISLSRRQFLTALETIKGEWKSDWPLLMNEAGTLISKRAVIYAAQSVGCLSAFEDGLTVFATVIARMDDSRLWPVSDLTGNRMDHRHFCSLDFVKIIIDLFEHWQSLVWDVERHGWGMCPKYDISLINSEKLHPSVQWPDHHPPTASNQMIKTRRLTVSQISRSFPDRLWRSPMLLNSQCFSIPMSFSQFVELVISMASKQR